MVLQYGDTNRLQKVIEQSTEGFFDFIFPFDWHQSLKINMISSGVTESCRNVIKELIFKHIGSKDYFPLCQIGILVVTILGSGKLGDDVCHRISKTFDKMPPWMDLGKSLCLNLEAR